MSTAGGYRAVDAASAPAYLVRHGILRSPEATVEVLGGGVSAEVLGIHAAEGAFVLKQALPRLRVEREWLAEPSRALIEARALRLASSIIPDAVPPLLLADEERFVLVLGMAPPRLRDWKSTLLRGGGGRDVETAERLGEVLALVHAGTSAMTGSLHDDFVDGDAHFLALRIEPFHRAAAAAVPELAVPLAELVDELVERRSRCLVHGDFSPKNVMADGRSLWVLDWEVAHLGNPVFDVAFLLAHLLCKSLHVRASRALYLACARSFLDAYDRGIPADVRVPDRMLVRHVAGLVLARVVGTSPAAYLTAAERATGRDLAGRWLLAPPSTALDLWSDLP